MYTLYFQLSNKVSDFNVKRGKTLRFHIGHATGPYVQHVTPGLVSRAVVDICKGWQKKRARMLDASRFIEWECRAVFFMPPSRHLPANRMKQWLLYGTLARTYMFIYIYIKLQHTFAKCSTYLTCARVHYICRGVLLWTSTCVWNHLWKKSHTRVYVRADIYTKWVFVRAQQTAVRTIIPGRIMP